MSFGILFPAAVDCGNLQSPDNGRIIFLDGTSFGSVARYECNNGFVLIGIPIRSCDEDGNWSGEAPVCQSKDSNLVFQNNIAGSNSIFIRIVMCCFNKPCSVHAL